MFLNVDQPILHLIRGKLVEYFQQSEYKLIGGTADGDGDAGVGQSVREVPRREPFEVYSIVRYERQILSCGAGKLLCVSGAFTRSVLSC